MKYLIFYAIALVLAVYMLFAPGLALGLMVTLFLLPSLYVIFTAKTRT